MTFKEAIDYLQPVADNTPLTGYGKALDMAIEALRKAEEGAVPVVRCRECWFCENGFCFNRNIGCGAATPKRNPDDFCSYGERRADND